MYSVAKGRGDYFAPDAGHASALDFDQHMTCGPLTAEMGSICASNIETYRTSNRSLAPF